MIGEDAREPLYLSAVVLGGALPDR
jgi:hypothetical protein